MYLNTFLMQTMIHWRSKVVPAVGLGRWEAASIKKHGEMPCFLLALKNRWSMEASANQRFLCLTSPHMWHYCTTKQPSRRSELHVSTQAATRRRPALALRSKRRVQENRC